MGKKEKRHLGPTDDSIRQFHDTYDEKRRYKKQEKRHRKKEKDRLREISKLFPEELEDD